MNGKFEDFKITTRVRSLNLWIQILLGIALYAGLNFAASRHYQRFDMSENRRNSLSPESVAYVKNLRKPVEIYAVVSMGRSDQRKRGDCPRLQHALPPVRIRLQQDRARQRKIRQRPHRKQTRRRACRAFRQRFGGVRDCGVGQQVQAHSDSRILRGRGRRAQGFQGRKPD